MPVDDLRVREVERFLANLEDLAAQLPAGVPAPATAVEGTDGSGTVHCVVDLGGLVSQVDITAGWWDRLGPAGVAAAVLDAWRFARQKAGWGRLIMYQAGHPYDRGVPRLEPEFALPAHDSPGYLAAVHRKLQHTEAVLRDARRLARARDSTQQRLLAGPLGLFELLLTGPRIVGARVDEHGLRPADAAGLADDARAALRAAQSPTFD